ELHGVREGDDLVVSSHGQTQRYHLPAQAALGPEAIRRMTDAIPLRKGTKFTLNTFITDYPQAVAVEQGQIVGEEPHDVRGKTRQLWKITIQMTVMPGLESVGWVDEKNNDVETDVTIPGLGEMKQYVTDRAECMKQPEGLDIFSSSLIRPQRAIPSPGDQASAVFRLTSVDLSKKLTLWNQDGQHVLSSVPGSSEVEVTLPRSTPADVTWQLPHADTPELHPYLQTSAYLEVDSPEIQALARQAVGSEKNPVFAAHLIERFVRNYITKKDLDIGFASALETARSREGDCTEHAVLCAALGRAAGLPTRCVLGFGYVPPGVDAPTLSKSVDKDTGLFAFHMWAEAWIGTDQWVPMDAALDGFDVGHIAITKTSLGGVDPLVDLSAPLWQLMENLKIEVLKTESKSEAAAALSRQAPSVHPSTPEKQPANSKPISTSPHLPPGID
ncbi:MAG TPA: transglutaminase-like domain-containing protein, partial [Candidatus Methylacidiphilales bacterium]